MKKCIIFLSCLWHHRRNCSEKHQNSEPSPHTPKTKCHFQGCTCAMRNPGRQRGLVCSKKLVATKPSFAKSPGTRKIFLFFSMWQKSKQTFGRKDVEKSHCAYVKGHVASIISWICGWQTLVFFFAVDCWATRVWVYLLIEFASGEAMISWKAKAMDEWNQGKVAQNETCFLNHRFDWGLLAVKSSCEIDAAHKTTQTHKKRCQKWDQKFSTVKD